MFLILSNFTYNLYLLFLLRFGNEIIHWMVFFTRVRSSSDTLKKTGYFTGSSSNSSFLYLSFVASPPRRWRMDL